MADDIKQRIWEKNALFAGKQSKSKRTGTFLSDAAAPVREEPVVERGNETPERDDGRE